MNSRPLTPNASTFREGKGTAFLVMDAVYLLAVFGWTIFLPPLGRDYAWLANWAPFGDYVPVYHAVNIVLLYAAMVLVFFLTRLATGGPWWLGSVAAVVFMAHPLKAEAVLNLCGMRDLIPAVLSLAALTAYAAARMKPGRFVACLTAVLFAAATLLVPGQGGLFFAIAAWELCMVPRGQQRVTVLMPFLGLAAVGWILHPPIVMAAPAGLTGAFWPIMYLAYPIGVLPETAAVLHAQPHLAVLALAGAAVLAVVLARAVRHPAFTLGLMAAAGLVLFGENRPVDPVHLIGGGRMLSGIALFSVALTGVFHRLLHHPAWPKATVWATSVLCIVLMIMQAQSNLAWNRAAKAVDAFRRAAFTAVAQHPGEPLGVFPDYRFCDGAPVQFAESVRHDTPFGKAFPVEVIASYDPISLDRKAFLLFAYGPQSASFAATAQGPFCVAGPDQRELVPQVAVCWNWLQCFAPRDVALPKRAVQVRVAPKDRPFPETRIAYP